ncbi:MAG: hypothetical protein JXJ04_17235 [Spirochaetales bacterium]|nr:hypothetical protein [Spirochaetales bacterium]
MKQSLQTIIKIVLLLLIGITLSIYFIPMSTEIPAEIINPVQKEDKSNTVDTEATKIVLQNPDNVAVLFGWIKPSPTPTPIVTPVPTATPVPTPVTPGWLKLIGKSEENNKQYYLFKDERYSTLIKVAKGVADKGWSFVKETENGYFLTNAGQEYFVRK